MWINIDIDLNIEEIANYLQELSTTSHDPIYLSFNTTVSYAEVSSYLNSLLAIIVSLGLDIRIGPHFVDEGFVSKGQIKNEDELYFLTPGEKVIWYTKHYSVPDIHTIIFLGTHFGIDPLIVKTKDKSKRYQYHFIQREPIDLEISKLIGNERLNLTRMKRNGYENNN